MRVVITAQDEPFFLANCLRYLIEILYKHSDIVDCMVNDVSLFEKLESIFKKAIKTYNVFVLS